MRLLWFTLGFYCVMITSAYVYRVYMIDHVPRISLDERQNPDMRFFPERLLSRLKKGDIVYMASTHTPLSNPSNHYAVMAAWWMKQPFYHVFLVLPDRKVGHFVAPNYFPRLTTFCGRFETGDLAHYIKERSVYDPLYMVFRHRTKELDYTPYLPLMCSLRFAPFPEVCWLWLREKIAGRPIPADIAHCNSYVGILLQYMGLLPPLKSTPATSFQSSHSTFTFIPSRMIGEFLPSAGFRVVGIYGRS